MTETVMVDSARAVDWWAVVKEAAITAAIGLALTVIMVGLRTVESGGGLIIETHLTEVAWFVVLVFVGRAGMALLRQGVAVPVLVVSLAVAVGCWFVHFPSSVLQLLAFTAGAVLAIRALVLARIHRSPLSAQERDQRMDRLGARFQDAARYLGPALLAFAAVLPLLPFADRYIIDIGTLALTYVMLGWGLNIVVGLAGLLDLGYVAFYAVGAYSYALLGSYFGWSFWVCLPLAGIMASCFGLLLGFPVLRLRGDYFAIVTLGFGEMIRIILLNWYNFTGGPNGLTGIPRPSFFGIAVFERSPPDGVLAFNDLFGIPFSTLQRVDFLYYLILVLALIVNFFTLRIRRLPLGRAWEALREDDIACTALGINRTNIKLAAFAIAAMFGGFAGSFFATRQGFISPESFSFMESAVILAIVVLGGMGSQLGVVIAAVLWVGLTEFFRDLAQYRMLAFGLGMVLIMVWRPRGLLAHRDPTLLLHPRLTARQRQREAENRA
ncbi:MAG: high-affinity branched-chain amino acid ABC transporter permease LivM [Azospirillaceae bacterium]|nr:high-affinity branched-chain amino acid ABC transporter permease LivM [Azospirillaceae bacterium]